MHALQYTVRRLRRQPGFALLTIATLALGFAASAAIFAVIDGVLLRPLPYPEPDRLIAMEHAAPGLDLPFLEISPRLYWHYREHNQSFSKIGLYEENSISISGLDRPLQVDGAAVTPSVPDMLGVRPLLGRLFTEREGQPGSEAIVLLSEGFWRRQMGADPEVLERSLSIDGQLTRIVGVLPESFHFPSASVELWTLRVIDPSTAPLGAFGAKGLARLAEEATLESAIVELRQLLGDLQTTFPEDSAAKVLAEAEFTATVRPFRDVVIGDVGPVLGLIFATVGFVLLLAVINVANLFVARAEGRQREMAIRSALGAGRRALTWHFMLDGLVLAIAAAGLGLVFGKMALEALLRLLPGELPRLEAVSIDARTVLVIALLSLVCGVLFGLIPQLRFRANALAIQLKEGGRTATSGRDRHRLRRWLVAAQMAIAILLLIGAALMTRSFAQLAQVDPGFEAAQRLSFRLALPEKDRSSEQEVVQFYDQLLERLEALPGVKSAASTTLLPLTGRDYGSGHRSPESPGRDENSMPTIAIVQSVSPNYFATLGLPLLEGRALMRGDFENRTGKVVVSQAFARLFWPEESALGKRVFPGTPGEGSNWLEVVGVVDDVRLRNLAEAPSAMIYYPWMNPDENLLPIRNQSIVLHFSGDPDAMMQAVRREVWTLDPNLPLAEIQSLESLLQRARARMAFTALMLALAAGVALLLGAVGTYGVISFLVTQRTQEIGVRFALGAQRGDVMSMVLREGLTLALAGSIIGLIAALALGSGLDAFLFGVSAHDPTTFAGVTFLLLTIVALACLVPAHRAAEIDPIRALRSE